MKRTIFTLILAGSFFFLHEGKAQISSAPSSEDHVEMERLPLLEPAKEQKNYGMLYFGSGVNHYVLPSLGVGYRLQKNLHTLDLYGSYSTLVFVNLYEVSACYLYGKDMYLGAGPLLIHTNELLPETKELWPRIVNTIPGGKAIIGLKFSEKSFCQIEVNAFHFSKPTILPTVGLRYGHGF